MLLTIYIQLYFLSIFRYFISYDLIFLRQNNKKNDLTRGWLEVGSWLEVDLGSRGVSKTRGGGGVGVSFLSVFFDDFFFLSFDPNFNF